MTPRLSHQDATSLSGMPRFGWEQAPKRLRQLALLL
jgi:hypothetical protein